MAAAAYARLNIPERKPRETDRLEVVFVPPTDAMKEGKRCSDKS
jgi:hypothetical protein